MQWKRSCVWLKRTKKEQENIWRREKMTKKTMKKEYQPGGSKRQEILTKAVAYLKDPRFGLQGDKHSFLTNQLGLSESEYLTCLNSAAGGNYWQ